jgi:hypothetical protein
LEVQQPRRRMITASIGGHPRPTGRRL